MVPAGGWVAPSGGCCEYDCSRSPFSCQLATAGERRARRLELEGRKEVETWRKCREEVFKRKKCCFATCLSPPPGGLDARARGSQAIRSPRKGPRLPKPGGGLLSQGLLFAAPGAMRLAPGLLTAGAVLLLSLSAERSLVDAAPIARRLSSANSSATDDALFHTVRMKFTFTADQFIKKDFITNKFQVQNVVINITAHDQTENSACGKKTSQPGNISEGCVNYCRSHLNTASIDQCIVTVAAVETLVPTSDPLLCENSTDSISLVCPTLGAPANPAVVIDGEKRRLKDVCNPLEILEQAEETDHQTAFLIGLAVTAVLFTVFVVVRHLLPPPSPPAVCIVLRDVPVLVLVGAVHRSRSVRACRARVRRSRG